MEKKDQYIINLLLFICFIVSFSFGEKTPVDIVAVADVVTAAPTVPFSC